MAGLTPLAQTDLTEAAAEGYVSNATENNLPVANIGPGSSLGALFNGAGLMGLLISANLQYVASVARLRNADGSLSCFGADIDSFFAPLIPPSESRVGEVATTGAVQITTSAPVPVGGIVQTPGGLQFEVIADLTNPEYVPASNSYLTSAGATVSVTVACLTLGVVGNVPSGAISQVSNGTTGPQITGQTNVTNVLAFSSGQPSESDEAFATRAEAIVAGGKTGSALALWAAAMGVQAGLTVQVGGALDANGNVKPANATVFVNVLGQSGGPPPSLIGAVQAAVMAKQSAGETLMVLAPTLIIVAASVVLKLDGSQTQATVLASAQAAFQSLVDGLGMVSIVTPPASSATTVLGYADVLDALRVPGVVRPSNLQLNGGFADLIATFGQQFISGTISITTD